MRIYKLTTKIVGEFEGECLDTQLFDNYPDVLEAVQSAIKDFGEAYVKAEMSVLDTEGTGEFLEVSTYPLHCGKYFLNMMLCEIERMQAQYEKLANIVIPAF